MQVQQKRRSQAPKAAKTADKGVKDNPSQASKHPRAAVSGEQKREKRNVRRPRPKGDGVYVPALYGVKPREITLSDVLVAGSAPKDARYSSGPKRRIHTSTSLQESKQFIGVVKPKRKKRLTPLKRKLLQERRMLHQQNVQDKASSVAIGSTSTSTAQSTVVEVQHFVEVGDQVDADEYAELLADLQALGAEFGEVVAAEIPRGVDGGSSTIVGPARLTFQTPEQATLAQLGLHGLVLGGVALATRMASCDTTQQDSAPTRTYDLFVDGCVRKSELEDEDEAAEVFNDLKALCGEEAQPLAIEVLASELEGKWGDCASKCQLPPHPAAEQGLQPLDDGAVCIYKFPTLDAAAKAAAGFDSKIVGGRVVRAVVDGGGQQQIGGGEVPKYSVRLDGFISAENVQDEEEKEEIVNGLKELLGDPNAEICVHATVEDAWVQLLASSSAQTEEYRAKLDGITVAGQQLSTSAPMSIGGAVHTTVVVWDLVTKEDLEGDEEELQEVLSDLRQLGEQYSPQVELEIVSLQDGRVLSVRDSASHGDGNDPFVTLRFAFPSEEARDRARARLDGKVVGGSAMTATVGQDTPVEEVAVEQPPPPSNPVDVQPSEQKAKREVVPHLPKHEAPALPIPVRMHKQLLCFRTRVDELYSTARATGGI